MPEIPLSAEVMDGAAGEVRQPLLVAWALGTALFLGLLLRDQFAIWRVVRRSRREEGGPWAACVREMTERPRRGRVPRVRVSSRIAVPCVTGVFRPVLLAPEAAPSDGQACRSIVAHELAHLKRRDMLWIWLASLLRAACWWHPLAWVLVRQLRRTSEEACDDWAIELGGQRTDYAQAMLASAELACAPGVLAVGHRGNMLLARIRRVLSEEGTPIVRVAAGVVWLAIIGTCSVWAVTSSVRVGWAEMSLEQRRDLNEQVLRDLAASAPEWEQPLVATVLAAPDSEAGNQALAHPVARPDSVGALPALAYALRSRSPYARGYLKELACEPEVANALGDALLADLSDDDVFRLSMVLYDADQPSAHLVRQLVRSAQYGQGWYDVKLAARRGVLGAPELEALLTSPQSQLRRMGLSVVGNAPSPPPEVLPLVVVALGDSDPQVRNSAAFALMMIDHLPPEPAAALGHSVADPPRLGWPQNWYGHSWRPSFLQTLSRLASVGPEDAPAIRKRVDREQKQHGWSPDSALLLGLLARTGVAEDAIPRLTDLLESPDADVRAEAAHGLARAGSAAEPARERLRALLADRDPRARQAAAHAMLRLGEPDPAVGILMRSLQAGGNDVVTRHGVNASLAATLTTWTLFPELRDVLEPHVLARAHNADSQVRLLALLAIRTMRATDEAAAAALEKLLEDPSPDVVVEALRAVSDLRLDTPRLAQTIGEMIRRRSGFSEVALGYPSIGRAAVPELIHFAESGGSMGDHACEALGRIGAPAASAIPTLERVLDSPGDHTVSCAAVALRRIREAMSREG